MLKMIKRIFRKVEDKKPEEQKKLPMEHIGALDPLDYRRRAGGWEREEKKEAVPFRLKTVGDFPFHETSTSDSVTFRNGRSVGTGELRTMAMDGKLVTYAMDDCDGGAGCGSMGQDINLNSYTVPDQLMGWYASQSFIGYQACAIIAQHWLVDKACSMSGDDAVRNGWEIKARGDKQALTDEQLSQIKQFDEAFMLSDQMKELNRFKNVFGIRILIFNVKSSDPKYYEKPFNIDGIEQGSYTGISQVDPYWMMPMMTAESTSDPSSKHFYDPEFWIISGKKYHRSHLIIMRGPEPADLLKPTYIFGGIPLTQRIYERVYAAERTANEAPLLAMSKRTSVIHTDMERAVADQESFTEKLMMWIRWRDNHAVKVLGEDESMEQFDTNLSDFDSVIMNQYQIVAAISKTPSTKLLGTSPKGFNSNGDYESINYHEELESIQKGLSPFLERHYMLSSKSMGLNIDIMHVWEPVDSVTMEQRAEFNKKKAELGKVLIDGGVISPDEERNRLRDDKHSGYNRLQDDDAETEPGMSPENLAKFEEAAASTTVATAKESMAKTGTLEKPRLDELEVVPFGKGPKQTQPKPEGEGKTDSGNVLANSLQTLACILGRLEDRLLPDGYDGVGEFDHSVIPRSVKPSVKSGMEGSTHSAHSVVGSMPGYKLPKLKLHGMTMAIENPRNTIRQGMDINGGTWSTKMPHHYGFIRGTKGADDEEIDCFIGENPESRKVFVINQNDESGAFDEHKCMIGFNDAASAKEAYASSFSNDWKGFGSIVPMSVDQFKNWMSNGDTYSPLSAATIAQTTSTPAMAEQPTGPNANQIEQE